MVECSDNTLKMPGVFKFTSAIIQDAYFEDRKGKKKKEKKGEHEYIHCLALILHATFSCALVILLLNNMNGINVKYEYN